jgi:hypothetical protein
MPTIPQIAAAKLQLEPQPYSDASKMASDDVATLQRFLLKYLAEHKMAGRYVDIQPKLAAATGIDAAFLRAILQNVSDEGSKKAKLNGELEYETQGTIDNELELALYTIYPPMGSGSMGSRASDMAIAIRAEFSGRPGCCGDEYQQTRCK